jgi:murein DD-endopeptidase MepM/ murein hydrolase activator NlpD
MLLPLSRAGIGLILAGAAVMGLSVTPEEAEAHHYFLRFPWWNGHPGYITQGYDQGTHTGKDKYALDIDIEQGGSFLGLGDVNAVAAGTVVGVVTDQSCGGPLSGYGNYVDVQTTDRYGNVRYSRYAHLSSVNVANGNTVFQGQKVGVEGNSGYSIGCAPHLHFRYATTPSCGDASCAVLPEAMSGQSGFATGQTKTSDNAFCPGGGPWSAWQDMGAQGTITSAPAVVSAGCNRLHVFVRGGDGALWLIWWNGVQWLPWQSLGGTLTSAPAAASMDYNTMHVYVRGGDGALWQRWWNGSVWSDWQYIGGSVAYVEPQLGGPAATSWGPNRLDVFVQCAGNNALWRLFWNGTQWSGWQGLGGTLNTAPAAASWGFNRIDVFARLGDGYLWHKYWNGSQWIDWARNESTVQLNAQPAAASWVYNHLNVFGRDTGFALRHRVFSGTWYPGWGNLANPPCCLVGSGPAAASWGYGRVDVFVRGTDAGLWHISH